jgi:V8-like Glu-specific endopeptidase
MTMRYVCRITRFGAFLVLSLLAMGCQKDRYSSDLPTPNGEFVSTISDSEYPAVVLVVAPGGAGICTGTFVSERAVLTASHCLAANGDYSVVSSFGTFRTSTKRSFGPGVVDDPQDIGMLIFNTDVASRAKGQVYDIHDAVTQGDTLRLVGYGCNNIETRRGSGVKRTGTNVVASVDDYINFLTPISNTSASRGIFGPKNRVASCFGDSGGPAALEKDGKLFVVGVTHAGGQEGLNQVSQYVNVATQNQNRNFLRSVDREFELDIKGI